MSVFISKREPDAEVSSFQPLNVPVPLPFDSKKIKSSVFIFSSPASGAMAARVANPLAGSCTLKLIVSFLFSCGMSPLSSFKLQDVKTAGIRRKAYHNIFLIMLIVFIVMMLYNYSPKSVLMSPSSSQSFCP